jgi:hypothetical protein
MGSSVRSRLVWLAAIPLAAWALVLVLAPRLRYAGVGIDDMGLAIVTTAALLACLVVALVARLAAQQGRSLTGALAWGLAAGAVTVALAFATVAYAILSNWAE